MKTNECVYKGIMTPGLQRRLQEALLEDLGGAGDVTSQALVPPERNARAEFTVKADGVLCGVRLLPTIFALAGELAAERAPAAEGRARRSVRKEVPPRVSKKVLRKDGARVKEGDVVATVSGNARTILAAERVSLNLLCHLSGVATATARYAEKIAHTKAKIVDTRKTTPLWRDLEKFAVTCGGGENHRLGLHDMILIKDNHLALWGESDPAGAVHTAQRKFPCVPVQVEVVDLAGLVHVCTHSKPDMVLLDNFTPIRLREAVQWCERFFARSKRIDSRPLLEASGGVTIETVAAMAEAGVDRISVGALTHSVRALDISLELKA